MAVPKKRTSAMKRDQRRSHHALTRSFAVICSNCGEAKLRHRICSGCGYYRGTFRGKPEAAATNAAE